MTFSFFSRARYTLPNLPFPSGRPMSKSLIVNFLHGKQPVYELCREFGGFLRKVYCPTYRKFQSFPAFPVHAFIAPVPLKRHFLTSSDALTFAGFFSFFLKSTQDRHETYFCELGFTGTRPGPAPWKREIVHSAMITLVITRSVGLIEFSSFTHDSSQVHLFSVRSCLSNASKQQHKLSFERYRTRYVFKNEEKECVL